MSNYLICAFKSEDDVFDSNAEMIPVYCWPIRDTSLAMASPLRLRGIDEKFPCIYIVSNALPEAATFAILRGIAFPVTIDKQSIDFNTDFNIMIPNEYRTKLKKLTYDK